MQKSSLKILMVGDVAQKDLLLRDLINDEWQIEYRVTSEIEGFGNILEEFDPEVILFDHDTVHWHGLDFLMIKNKKRSTVPFIVISDSTDTALRKEYMVEKAWAVTKKDNLVAVIRRWLCLNDISQIKGIDDNNRDHVIPYGTDVERNEEFFQRILEVTTNGLWEWDIEKGEMYFTPRFFTMLGYLPEDFDHKRETFESLVHPDDKIDLFKRYQNNTLVSDNRIQVEVRMKRKDGSYALVLVKAKIYRKRSDKNPLRVIGLNEDISLKKRHEETKNVLIKISDAVNSTSTLEEFFERIQSYLSNVIDTTNFFVALYDRNSDRITLPFHRDTKDKFKELPAGKTITSYVLKTGKSQLLDYNRIQELESAGEFEIIGTTAFSWLGVPLRSNNELIGVFVVQSYDESVRYSVDDMKLLEFVSDHFAMAISSKREHENNRINQERQRKIIESSPDGLAIINREGIISDHNSRLKSILNMKSGTLNRQNLLEYLYPLDQKKFCDLLNTADSSGNGRMQEIRMLGADGIEFFAELSISVFQRDELNNVSFILTIKNIDERKAYEMKLKEAKERAEESDRLKTAFLSNMSHEIRTPMNAIVGFAELLSHTDITEDDKKEFITHINSSANSLLRLIDDIIDIAKIESGQLKIYNSFFNLSGLLKELYVYFSGYLDRQNKPEIKLLQHNDNFNTDIQMYGDQSRVRQVFSNLLSNAIKFTDSGEIHFGISHFANGIIRFYVKDTGIGISKEQTDIIFGRFRQASESRTKFYGGTGLGLTISKYLVERMGGEINVESEPGKGSLFTFTCPVHMIEENIKRLESSIDKNHLNWEGRTVLIAEDEISNFILLKEILKSTKITAIWARDGNEVIEIFSANPNIDLILMDIQLPYRNGYEAAKIIKKIKKSVPIIAQTAYSFAGEKQNSIEAGCDDYISKPIHIRELMSLMSKYLKN